MHQLADYGDGILSLSVDAVRRALSDAGIYRHAVKSIPVLDSTQCLERVEWAKEHLNWSIED